MTRLLALIALIGCRTDTQRMLDQSHDRPAIAPPADAVPYGAAAAAPPVEPYGRAALEHGRAIFETTCAACHGVRGDGDSPVARHMELRPPPSLLDPAMNDRRVISAMLEGFGLMRPYSELSAGDRADVLGYLGALRLSQAAPLDQLPARLRERFR